MISKGTLLIVAQFIYEKFFEEIVYEAWSPIVNPQSCMFYYGANFLRLASLNKPTNTCETDYEQFVRVYVYVINWERPVAITFYGLSKKESSFFTVDLEGKLEDFLKNPFIVPLGEALTDSPSVETGLKLSFAGADAPNFRPW